MSEEGEGRYAEGTLCRVNLKTCALQDFENQAEVPHVLGKILAGDQNVVEVHEHEREMAEEFVHQTLKCLRSIFQTKGHENVLKQTEWRTNCRFRYVAFRHWHG